MVENRKTAEQRRVQAVEAGLEAFADHGLTTTAIQCVARRIGVSQPYVFRLFGSKRVFFLACLDEFEARVVETFAHAARDVAAEPMEQMGAGFRALVADGVVSGLWVQACAVARADEVVAHRCRTLISNVLRAAQGHTGANTDELAAFVGRGVLVLTLQGLGVDLRNGSQVAVGSLLEAGDAP